MGKPLTADDLWLIDRFVVVSKAVHGKPWGARRIAANLNPTRSKSVVAPAIASDGSIEQFAIEVRREASGNDAVYRNGVLVGTVSPQAVSHLLRVFPSAASAVDLPEAFNAPVEVNAPTPDPSSEKSYAGEPENQPPHETSYREKSDDEIELSSRSATITSLEELLAFFHIDTAIWEADRPTINTWQNFYKRGSGDEAEAEVVTLYQIKTTLRRRVSRVMEDSFAMLMERMRAEAPLYPHRSYRGINGEPHLLEVAIYDHHFGKLAWHVETGEDYDVRIADQLYRRAVDQILARARPYCIDRILMPIGHDLLNYDNARGETTAGTPQDNDSRPAKVFSAACSAVIYAIERLVEVSPVDVIYVPGNHDTNTGRYVTCVAKAWFDKCEEVTVDDGPAPYKHYVYGDVFLGLTHGDGPQRARNQLPMTFASQFREEWGKARHHEIHLGHFHTKHETSFMPLFESGGVLMRVLPSLCGRDYWHTKMGYLGGSRATDAFLWSATKGLAGYFTTSAEELLS